MCVLSKLITEKCRKLIKKRESKIPEAAKWKCAKRVGGGIIIGGIFKGPIGALTSLAPSYYNCLIDTGIL